MLTEKRYIGFSSLSKMIVITLLTGSRLDAGGDRKECPCRHIAK
ncbi:hypothetical protein GFS60_04865 [Rhodococcus sp. WAY2]|nr:hypothetical protein GFS60_04865 [Rhodococcus sp. WAY2]